MNLLHDRHGQDHQQGGHRHLHHGDLLPSLGSSGVLDENDVESKNHGCTKRKEITLVHAA